MTYYKIYYEIYYSSGVNSVTFDSLEKMKKYLEIMRERNKSIPSYFNIECKKETIEHINI